jgi:protein-tyrosine phosphatase
MLHFLRKPIAPRLPFLADMHSHLLPGVDDGSPDIGASLDLIGGLMELGYRKVVTTPHVYAELYPNTTAGLQNAYNELVPFLQEKGDLSFHFAAEYFLDDHFKTLLKSGQPLLTIHDNWVLTETSFVQAPFDLDDQLFDIQMGGYQPILAHPERYAYWHGNKEKYHGLRERGILLQVNLLSLTGYYGKPVAETARYLVKEELVDLVGTDCHHQRHITALRKAADGLTKQLGTLLRKDKLLNTQL